MSSIHTRVAVVFGALVLALVIAVFNAASFLAAPGEPPRRADCIVVLGGGAGDRVEMAVELYRRGFAGRLLLTGVNDSPVAVRQSYLDWRAFFLVAQGVPETAILYDKGSANSLDEARYALRLANENNWHSMLVVSDPPHMRRLAGVWDDTLRSSNVSFSLVATSPAWWRQDGWWKSEPTAQFVLAEYIKIFYHLLFGYPVPDAAPAT